MGWTNLVNMDGGFHGRPNEDGTIAVQGWAACGFETSSEPIKGRSWGELEP